jgi:peptide/nickel transport system substrate-binding protein
MIARITNDVLVTVDETGKPLPMLASEVPTLANHDISPDGLTITYKLRHGVLWHDGVPFSSKDVKFSIDAINNTRNNIISKTGYELVRSVDTPDPYTVVLHMKKAFSPAINTIFAESDSPYAIVPEHILAKYPNINSVPYNADPVGTGPYVFKRWLRGDHIEFAANEHYFLGAPKIKDVIVKIVPDENTELQQLRSHELDWQFEASPQEYSQLKTISNLNIVLQNRNEYERIEINNRHVPLNDVRVREAISYAVDRARLTNDLTYGSAVTADQDLPPFMWAHATDITRYTHDTAKAAALLRAAGFTRGPDGYMQHDGKRLTLEITYNTSNATRRRAVVEVQAMLKDIGVDTDVKPYIATLLFAPIGMGGILQSGKYDLSWTGWVAGIDPDNSSLFMTSAQPPNGNNSTFYSNPQMDAAQERAITSFDIPTRKRAYATIEALLTHDVPVIPVWWPRQIQPVNPDLHGFRPNPVTADWNMQEWSI